MSRIILPFLITITFLSSLIIHSEVLAEKSLLELIPESEGIPFLNNVTVISFTEKDDLISVTGSLEGENITIEKTSESGSIQITGDNLPLKDFIPEISSVPFLDEFALDKLSLTDNNLDIVGKVGRKSVKVSKSNDSSSFSVTGNNLALTDFVTEAKGVSFFNEFAFDRLDISNSTLDIEGLISSKKVNITKSRTDDEKVIVKASELTLGDLFEEVKSVQALNDIALDKVELDGKTIEVEAELNNVTVDIIKHADASSYVAIYFEKLDAATFIPSEKGHVLNDMSLDNALFILQSSIGSMFLKSSDLPGELPTLVNWEDGITLKVSTGLSLAATIDVRESNTLKNVFNTIGIDSNTLFIEGALEKNALNGVNNLSSEQKKSLLASLFLNINVPVPKISNIESFATLKNPVNLTINGTLPEDSLWNQLPDNMKKTMPLGDVNVMLSFGISLEIDNFDEDIDALIDIGSSGDDKSLSLIAFTEKPWEKPFGIEGLTISKSGFEIQVEESDNTKDANIGFFGIAEIGRKKNINITADFEEKDSKLSLNYFDLDGQILLSDFGPAKKIPYAKKFLLSEVKITTDGIEAKTSLAGKEVDAYLFKTKGSEDFTFAIEQKNFRIASLLHGLKNNHILKKLKLPKAALIISQNGLNVNKEDMPIIVADLFNDIIGTSNINIKIDDGIGLIADFHPDSMGIIGSGLSGLGVHDDAVIMGEITGVFKGRIGFKLDLIMEQTSETSNLPNEVMNYKEGIVPQFFIQYKGEDIYVGTSVDMEVKAGHDTLDIVAAIELQFNETGIGVDILGKMDGTWHKPFGINGMELSNLIVKAGIDSTGTVKIGFAGEDKIGKEDIQLATELDILLADALPDGVAFSGTINNLGIPAIIDIAETLLKLPGKLSNIPIPFFEIHNANIAFATPGATDPQLGLVKEGFAFAGDFYFMNKELGSISGSGGPTSGVVFNGKIDDIKLSILEFKENSVDIAINNNPKFKIISDIKLLGATSDVVIDLEPPHFEFDITEDMGHFGNADLRVRLDGFDLTKGKFDNDADVSVIGEFNSTLLPWMKTEIQDGIDELKKSATAKLENTKKLLTAAQTAVKAMDTKIANQKKADQQAKKKADASINKAKKRVSDLKNKIDHDNHQAGHCGNHFTHWACSGYWKAKAVSTTIVYKVAEAALDVAKDAVNVAANIDPKLVALYVERDTELAALAIAKAAVTVAEDAEKAILNELDTAISTALENFPFELEQAIIIGDLKDMIENDDPLVLDISFKVFGKKMREYFAIKLRDPEFDAISFALLPAIILDEIVERAASKFSKKAGTWIKAHIGEKLAEAEDKVRNAVLQEEEKYKDVLASFENNSAKYKQAYADIANEVTDVTGSFLQSDLLGISKTIPDNSYLAIGHSSLCLGVSADANKVLQKKCVNGWSERWSTRMQDDGYVWITSRGLCLTALSTGNKKQGQPLKLGFCNNNDIHLKWKITSADGFYYSIINKFSQKCLHFSSENANPKVAHGVWTSCIGVDSQSFRPINDAQKPSFISVNSKIKSKNGSCLKTDKNYISYFIPTNFKYRFGGAKLAGDTIKDEHFNLYSTNCSNSQDLFNYVEEVNGDIKIVHSSGWCVSPVDHNSNKLKLTPCNLGSEMIWRVNEKAQGSFDLVNVSHKKCMNLFSNSSSSIKLATMESCKLVDEQYLSFTKN